MKKYAPWIIIIILSLSGTAVVLLGISRYGTGLSPDSVMYISAAKNLLSGKGLTGFDGKPYMHWPPLYPVLLAITDAVGIDPVKGAGFLNALFFGSIVFTSGLLFIRYIRSKSIVILAVASVLLSVPLLNASVLALTEPLFILLAVVFVLALDGFLIKPSWLLLFLLSVIAALSTLQRYIGITLALTGLILILTGTGKSVRLSSRLKYSAAFGVIYSFPVLVWVIRNYFLSHTLTSPSGPPTSCLGQNLRTSYILLKGWFFTAGMPSAAKPALVLLLLMSVLSLAPKTSLRVSGSFITLRFCRRKTGDAALTRRPLAVTGFILVYSMFLIVYASFGEHVVIENRKLAPVYVLVMVLFFTGLDRTSNRLGSVFRNNRLVKAVLVLLCTVWLSALIIPFYGQVKVYMRNGAGGYHTARWIESPVIKYLRDNPLIGKIYSNAPDGIYILTGIPASISPKRETDMKLFRDASFSEDKNILVWFDGFRPYMRSIGELGDWLEFEKIYPPAGEAAKDAIDAIYLFRPSREYVKIDLQVKSGSDNIWSGNRLEYSIDGNMETRWASSSLPAEITYKFTKPSRPGKVRMSLNALADYSYYLSLTGYSGPDTDQAVVLVGKREFAGTGQELEFSVAKPLTFITLVCHSSNKDGGITLREIEFLEEAAPGR